MTFFILALLMSLAGRGARTPTRFRALASFKPPAGRWPTAWAPAIGMPTSSSSTAVGVSYRRYEANYGIPVSEDGDAIPGGDPGVTLDLEQDSYKFLGEISRPFGGFEGARLQVVRRAYTHAEIEDTGDVGTVFNIDTTEMRADLTHRALGRWKGSFGLWHLDQEFDAEGDEDRGIVFIRGTESGQPGGC